VSVGSVRTAVPFVAMVVISVSPLA
jgi:hypothetical protein